MAFIIYKCPFLSYTFLWFISYFLWPIYLFRSPPAPDFKAKLLIIAARSQGHVEIDLCLCRFGKHRKTLDVPLQLALRAEQEQMERGEEHNGGGEEEREAARRAAQEEQQRIQEQYRRLMQRQRQMESQVREGDIN